MMEQRTNFLLWVLICTTLISYYKEWYWKQVDNGNVQFNEEFATTDFDMHGIILSSCLTLIIDMALLAQSVAILQRLVMNGVASGIRKSFMPWIDYLNHPYSVDILNGR